MRILCVTAQKPNATGSGTYLTETVNAFAAMGHQVAVVAGVYREDKVSFAPGVTFAPCYFRTPLLPFPICGMSDEMPYESTQYRRMTTDMVTRFREAFTRTLQEIAARFQPELILCHHLYLLTALTRELFPALPVWGVCHGSDLRQMGTTPLCREEIRRGVAALDRICCLHEAQRERVTACYGVPRKKTTVAGVGYNNGIFYDRHIRTPHEETRLVFAGKISEKKGVFSLLTSLDLLGWSRERFSLHMAGGFATAAQQRRMEECLAACGWDVKLLGALRQDELARTFCQGDVFILPSFYEGLPLVLVEALACGMNAVCTDLPGVRAWMDQAVPGHGVHFVPPPRMRNADEPIAEDIPEFERALAEGIREAAKEAGKGQEGPDVRGLSWGKVCERMLGGEGVEREQ